MLFRAAAPRAVAAIALDRPYLLLAVLLNVPGNSVIGGGGGLCLLAGLIGVYRPRWMLPTLALATAPVPLAVALTGWTLTGRLPPRQAAGSSRGDISLWK